MTELDFTLVDRINNILTPEKILVPHPPAGVSMYATAMVRDNCFILNEPCHGKAVFEIFKLVGNKAACSTAETRLMLEN